MSHNGVLAYVPDDGYTEPGYLTGVRNLYPPCRFSYRPMLTSERMDFIGGNASLKPRQQNQRVAELLAKRITKWDLKKPDGSPVPLVADQVLRLKPALFERLYEVVLGTVAYDDDPDAPADQEPAFDEAKAAKNS